MHSHERLLVNRIHQLLTNTSCSAEHRRVFKVQITRNISIFRKTITANHYIRARKVITVKCVLLTLECNGMRLTAGINPGLDPLRVTTLQTPQLNWESNPGKRGR